MNLIRAAGSALEALTTFKGGSKEDATFPRPIEEQKEEFTVASSQYLNLLSSIDVQLRRQINALQDAEIIPAEAATRDTQINQAVPSALSAMNGSAALSKQVGGSRAMVTGGGLGSLDVGWLNSRNDHIGKGMEAELWEEAQNFVEKLKQKEEASQKSTGNFHTQSTEERPQDLGEEDESLQMDQN